MWELGQYAFAMVDMQWHAIQTNINIYDYCHMSRLGEWKDQASFLFYLCLMKVFFFLIQFILKAPTKNFLWLRENEVLIFYKEGSTYLFLDVKEGGRFGILHRLVQLLQPETQPAHNMVRTCSNHGSKIDASC